MSSTPREIGTLIAVLLKARNLPNKRHIGKQDPYCTIILNGEKRRTKAIKRGGQHPEWDEEIRFTVFEDVEPERTPLPGDGTPPPPPPKKNEKGPPRIKGGKFMSLACWAEDLREPDFIGETKVDLTEVLTKGETDEWFTLMSKDKYCGEVYLELTFWSNEPAPAKKSSPKGDTRQNYGGPGTFTPTRGGISPSPSPNGGDRYSYRPRVPSMSTAAEDSIPSALRASNPSVQKFDLYSAPYETSRSHQQVSSMDSLTNDFAEFGVQDSHNRRISYPPAPSAFDQSPSRFSDHQPFPSQYAYGYDSGSFTGNGSSSTSITPTNSTYQQQTFPPSGAGQYRPPYETAAQSYSTTRRPRYSVPVSSSGFMPVSGPTPTPSPFPFLPSQPTGFVPPPAATPAPLGYGRPPLSTPAPLGYGPPPSVTPPAPTPAPIPYNVPSPQTLSVATSFTQPPPPSTPTPAPYNTATIRHSMSYQQLPQSSFPYPQQQQYQAPALTTSLSQPYLPSQTPALPPNPAPQQPIQQPYIPPPPPLSVPPPPPPVSTPPDHGFMGSQFMASSSQMQVPPPPPLNGNISPVYGQTSRPLPQPTQQGIPPPPRRQSTLPTPPMANGGFVHTNIPNQPMTPIPTNPAFNASIPPPPPLPAQQQVPFPPSPQHYTPPPPPAVNRVVSSVYPTTSPHVPMPATPPMMVPPPPPLNNQHNRRASLPAPPMSWGQKQSVFQSLPPPPVPPSLPQSTGSTLVRMSPSGPVGQAMYPGPLPRPPSQYIPPSYSYPAPVTGGGWQ